MTYYSAVTDGYFEAMGIPLVAGRTFTATDRDTTARVIVVSQGLALRFWPDSDPIGKRIRLNADIGDWRTIVGVVGDVRDQSLGLEPSEMIYYPAASSVSGHAQSMSYPIRSMRASNLAALAWREVSAIDPNLPIASAEMLERIVADSVVRQSFTLLALIVAAVIALFLGTIGLYGRDLVHRVAADERAGHPPRARRPRGSGEEDGRARGRTPRRLRAGHRISSRHSA